MAGQGMDLLLEGAEPSRVFGRERPEHAAIDPHATKLHPGEHRRQRQFHLLEQGPELHVAKPIGKQRRQLPHEPAG